MKICLSVHLFACISAATTGRIYVKSDIRDFYENLSVCLSVHLFACISAATTGRIYVKSDIRDFYENLSRKSKFG